VGGTGFLPGTSRAADRFARASFGINAVPRSVDPNAFWVDLGKMDFNPGAGTKRLLLTGGKFYSGETSKHFEPAQPFKPLSASTSAAK